MAELSVKLEGFDLLEEVQNTIDEQDAILLYILANGYDDIAKTMLSDYMEYNKGVESRLICLN